MSERPHQEHIRTNRTSDYLIRTRQEAEFVEAASRRLDFEQSQWKRRPAAWILNRASGSGVPPLGF